MPALEFAAEFAPDGPRPEEQPKQATRASRVERDDPPLPIMESRLNGATHGAVVAIAGRELPHSLEAEAGLLACGIIDGSATVEACHVAGIVPDSFYSPMHREIFEALIESCEQGDEPINVILLSEVLQKRGSLDSVGGPAAINSIANSAQTTAHAAKFIEIIREKHILRRSIRAATYIVESAFQPEVVVDDLVTHIDTLAKQTAGARRKRKIVFKGPFDFVIPPDDDPSILLGKNRWLCRGDGAVWVANCLHGNTRIPDPVDGTNLTVEERWLLGRPFHVTALDHIQNLPRIAVAHAPRRFAVNPMIRLKFSNQEEMTVTPGHYFWTGSRYVETRELYREWLSGNEVLLPTISGISQQELRSDAQDCSQKARDFPDCCSPDCRRDDERLLQEAGTGSAAPPLQADVRARIHSSLQTDVLVAGEANSHRHLVSGRPSTTHCLLQNAPDFVSESPASQEIFELSGYSHSSQQQLGAVHRVPCRAGQPSQFFHETTSGLFFEHPKQSHAFEKKQIQPSGSFRDVARSPSALTPVPLGQECVRVVHMQVVDPSNYFDFFVPDFNNYSTAGGVVSHNSGVGKSVLAVQAMFAFAVGRPLFGIPCPRPLKQLMIQAEDADGDVAESTNSCHHKMNFTHPELELLAKNAHFYRDKENRGKTFIKALREYVRELQPDIVWLNPLQSFASCDLTDMEQANEFLRGGLNAVNHEDKFAIIVIHHTTKPPTGKNVGPTQWNQVMYDMAGSHAIIDWARSIVSLKATDTPGHFKMMLSKRGSRAGITEEVRDANGIAHLGVVTEIPIAYCNETMAVEGRKEPVPVLFWEHDKEPPAKLPPQFNNGKPGALGEHDPFIADQILTFFPPDPRQAKPHVQLMREIRESLGYKETVTMRARDALLAQNKVSHIAGKWFRRM